LKSFPQSKVSKLQHTQSRWPTSIDQSIPAGLAHSTAHLSSPSHPIPVARSPLGGRPWQAKAAGHDGGRMTNTCSRQPPLPTHVRRHASLPHPASLKLHVPHRWSRAGRTKSVFLHSQVLTSDETLTQQPCRAEKRMHRTERYSRWLQPWEMEKTC
jgi:hypothetical protein